MNLVNLILNIAQFISYRNYIRERYEEKKNRTHAKYLLKELKREVRFYLNLKFNQKKLDKNENSKLCQYLNF